MDFPGGPVVKTERTWVWITDCKTKILTCPMIWPKQIIFLISGDQEQMLTPGKDRGNWRGDGQKVNY